MPSTEHEDLIRCVAHAAMGMVSDSQSDIPLLCIEGDMFAGINGSARVKGNPIPDLVVSFIEDEDDTDWFFVEVGKMPPKKWGSSIRVLRVTYDGGVYLINAHGSSLEQRLVQSVTTLVSAYHADG